MGERNVSAKGGRVEEILISIFCAAVVICSACVLLFLYRPNRNALGALGTVCMDVVSMLITLILVINMTFDRSNENHTTRLFLRLLVGTMLALFLDFLTWSFDGALEYGGWTYVFTLASLCMGAILAYFFIQYLGSYISDMYGMNSHLKSVKVCATCNLISYVITASLAVSGRGFIFVDGHYQTGPLYDVVTAIPLMTLLYMMCFCIKNVKAIGVHDVIAVIVYMVTMIIGVVIEMIYRIGTTYVSLTIAAVFIFVMLQNKLMDRLKQQREALSEQVTDQMEILASMAAIYAYVNYVDLVEMTAKRFNHEGSIAESLNPSEDPHSTLNVILSEGMDEGVKEQFLAYTDLKTLPERMKGVKDITAEFHHGVEGWLRAQYIRIGNDNNAPLEKVIYTIRNIDEEKKNVEMWIKKSNTDELTGLLNRHAYEDEITALEEEKLSDNFVYISIDVNSLKLVNDSAGHEAGDELLVGACNCMKQSLGSYGKLFRTGGDEFIALIFADEVELENITKDIEELTGSWKGKLIDGLTISYGYVTRKENPKLSIREMAVLADKRMYETKDRYYRERGIDRRRQLDMELALLNKN